MGRCYNGHNIDHPGCSGCHHAFHVKQLGHVEGGRLIQPIVEGPEGCDLCHEARHAVAVRGCPRCDAQFPSLVAQAQQAAAPMRQRIVQMRIASWMLGWWVTLAGWLTVIAGGTWGDWFARSDGSNDWVKQGMVMIGIPLVQWAMRREIRRKERQLPRLSPTGEIVYGEPAEDKGS